MSTPEDPFEGEFPEGFERFPAWLQEFTRRLDRARPVVAALAAAQSFQELATAIHTLDDDERFAVLLWVYIDIRRQQDPNWADWFGR